MQFPIKQILLLLWLGYFNFPSHFALIDALTRESTNISCHEILNTISGILIYFYPHECWGDRVILCEC